MEGISWDPAVLWQGKAWRGFEPGRWLTRIDVRDFIVRNATPYEGSESFLAGPSDRTVAFWAKLAPSFKEERVKGVLDVDVATNCIHYMHDKYFYERLEMALHDRDILRTMAFGVAGLSVATDSLSAIKHAKVHVIRDETGLAIDYRIEGAFPTFGNHMPEVDDMAAQIVARFMAKLRKHPAYRNATHTQSVLTITSNVVYGKATGNTPDGRRKGEPFAPGANPMHGRDNHGWLASCLSVASLPYAEAQDGISYTVTIQPALAARDSTASIDNAVNGLDMYFGQGGFHLNLNVLSKEMLEDAMEHPKNYPQLTIRVSGYAVNFVRLTREQQLDILHRTFHGSY